MYCINGLNHFQEPKKLIVRLLEKICDVSIYASNIWLHFLKYMFM